MNILEKRQLFAEHFAKLILYAVSLGYQVTMGEVERSKEQAAANARAGVGIKNSLHILGLAGDLNLFKNGKYFENSEDHAELGKFWQSLSTLEAPHCWGGLFKDSKGRPKPDGNHYSIMHNGIK